MNNTITKLLNTNTKQVALDPPESHTCLKKPLTGFQNFGNLTHESLLIKERNKLAHLRFSEIFQAGLTDLFNAKLYDVKHFFIENYTKTPTIFTAHKIESLISTALLLIESDSIASKIAAITLCINSITGKAVSQSVLNFLMMNYLDFTDNESLQASPVRELLDNWDRMNDSIFIDKIRNVASYCMSFALLENMGLDESVAEIMYAEFKVQKKTKQITSFIHAILDAIEFTCSRMMVCISEKSFGPLFHTVSTYTKWFDETQKLEKWTSMLTCDPDVLTFTYQEYEKNLIDCINRGNTFIKYAKSNNDRRNLNTIVNRLELFLADYQTKHIVGKSRIMPFGVSLYGDSSIGKSTLADILFSYSAKVLKQKDDPEYKYTRNFRDPFWSGFKSHMWFILLDDVGSIKPSAVNGTDPSTDEIISLMNTVSLLCNMADLSEKGRVAARPLVVVATTNHPWMNVHHYSYHPSALMRRFPYRITATVKPEFQVKDAPTMLDPTKCQVNYDIAYPDFWNLTVDKVLATPLPKDQNAQPNVEPILIKILDNVSMGDFLPWYSKALLDHMESQKTIKEKLTSMTSVQMCHHNLPLGNCKSCSTLQAGGLIRYVPSGTYSIKEYIIAYCLMLYLFIFSQNDWQSSKRVAFGHTIPMLRLTNNISYGLSRLPTKNDFEIVANNFKKFAMENKRNLLIVSTLSVTAIMMKLLKTTEAFQFSFRKPVPKNEKNAAIWTNEQIRLSPLTLSRQTKSMKGLTPEEVCDIIAKNVVSITLISDNKCFDNNMFCIGGNYYLINSHVLDLMPDTFNIKCVTMVSPKAGTRNTTIFFDKKSIVFKKYDVCIVEINNFPPGARLDHLFPSEGFEASMHGTYIKRDPSGNINTNVAKNIHPGTLNLLSSPGYWSDCITNPGDCGMPLVGFTYYGPVILGIHTAARVGDKQAFCSQVFKEFFDTLTIIDSGSVTLQCNDKEVELYPVINRRDPSLFVEESSCAIYGTLSTGTSNLKSSVRESSIAPFFKSKGWETNAVKPNLGTWKPWYHSFKDMAKPDLSVSSFEAMELANITLQQHFSDLPEEELILIELYDFDTAVSGVAGVNYVNSLPMSTSLGFPWRKPKNTKITFQQDLEIYVVDDEITSIVNSMLEDYKNGIRCNPIFCASEKDEARDREKNVLGKIRIFMGSPTPFIIVMRMFFGSLIRVIQRNPASFECAVGINAHSKEWHTLATDMLQFGENNTFDGDYKSYDKLMEAVLIYSSIIAAGNQIILNLSDKCGYSDDELTLIYKTIAADVAFAYIDFNGTLVSFFRNHVSGECLTVIVNCFVNSIYFRYCYRKTVCDDYMLQKFKERVKLRCYGDDVMVAVSDSIKEQYNFDSTQKSLSLINVTFTRADKKEGTYYTKNFHDLDFLKRGFVYSEELGRYVGPLAIQSIKKSFLIGLCSKSITQEERDLATMTSGLREFFFHGREVYDINRQLILECCEQLQIRYNPKNFPTYDHYLNEYKNNDIVHYQFYELEVESKSTEELQIGNVYIEMGSVGEDFVVELNNDFIVEYNLPRGIRITHIAFLLEIEIKSLCLQFGLQKEETQLIRRRRHFRRIMARNSDFEGQLLIEMDHQIRYYLANGSNGSDRRNVECVETFQHGTFYCISGRDDEIYRYKYLHSNFLVSLSSYGNYKVTHIATMEWQQLQKIIEENHFYIKNKIKFRVNHHFMRVKMKVVSNYECSLMINTQRFLKQTVEENNIFLQLDELVSLKTKYTDDGRINPFAYRDYKRMFNNNKKENKNHDTVSSVALTSFVRGSRDLTLHASSGDSEHYVRQDEEIFQSGKVVTLTFADESKGDVAEDRSGRDSTRETSSYSDAGISKFLERPVLIQSLDWAENTNVNLGLNPFHLFFNDSRIKNKITNYSLLRCKLRIKLLINASPFYYGFAKVIWKPLINFCPDNWATVVGQEGWKVPFSQVPGFYINVAANEGGEMELPFFYPKNWIDVTSATDLFNMGELRISSLTPLLNANSVSGADVTIQVYAWAEDIELSGPTIKEALQSGDEYNHDGPISGPASAVASAANKLSNLPIIGPYARATEMLSTSIGNVAHFFGFTNVANIESEVPQHPGAFTGMSSTNLKTPYESLAVDDKNELSIDPRIAGIDSKDELMISEICGRESWIWQSNWSSSQNTGSLLFLSRVMPDLIRNENSLLFRQSTPMAHINRMFSYWRGPINFRFRFICSKYHRGRVRITYDPCGNLFTDSVTSTTSVTRIVDISEEMDVTLEIPYMQALSFLKTANGLSSYDEQMNGGTAALPHNGQFDNGQISVRVFTKQTSPVSDAPIIMQVFVSAPKIEFAAPCEVPKDYSFETLQSGMETELVSLPTTDEDDKLYLVHHGEKIVSMRQLMRRKNIYCTIQLTTNSDNNTSVYSLSNLTIPRLPVPYGYATKGGFQSPGLLVPGMQFPCNYVANTPLSLLTPCFVGVSGSMVYTVNADSPYPVSSVYASRSIKAYNNSVTGFKTTVSSAVASLAPGFVSKMMYYGESSGNSGRVLTNQNTQAGITFKAPMYSAFRFLATDPNNTQSTVKSDGSEFDTISINTVTKPATHNNIESRTHLQIYYMAGSDFNLLYFRNIPTIYVYTLPWPTA